MNTTFRNNILFGQPMDMDYYKKVIKYCELEKDIAMLKGGDMVEIGEKGINLSGGQKARLSLARAVYSRAHIYLLDDPLSAVDAHVGRNIFKNVIGPTGLLKNKCRILVTHAVQYLPSTDYIYYMEDGKIAEEGTYQSLFSSPNSRVVNFVGEVSSNTEDTESEKTGENAEEGVYYSSDDGDSDGNEDDEIRPNRKYSPSIVSRNSMSTIGTAFDILLESNYRSTGQMPLDTLELLGNENQNEPDKKAALKEIADEDEGRLIEKETSQQGRVKLGYFLSYVRAATVPAVLLYVILILLATVFSVLPNIWLQIWSNDNSKPVQSHSTAYYIAIYGAFGLIQAILASSQNMVIWILVSIRAAKKTHFQLLKGVLGSPMSFFDTTPLGRILNRFSKDQETIDIQIPRSFDSWAQSILTVIASLIVITVSFYYFAAVIVPISVVYVLVYQYYIKSSRELKRLESVTRSPIYAQFQETLSGTTTIRSFGHNDRFISSNIVLIEKNTMAQFPYLTLNRWLAVRLEFIGALIIFFTALFAVINVYVESKRRSGDVPSAARVGLAISYSLSITQNLSWGIRQTAELENNVVSVERNKEFSTLPPEGFAGSPKVEPPKGWPSKGEIEFSGYSTRYREGLDLVLNDVNLKIPAGSKVGVVGRTGAGKSSMSMSLFRIIEAASGFIQIDGIKISEVDLETLRSNLVIIPQDPFLFGDTLRNNLDSMGQYTDAEIWEALEKSKLRAWVEEKSSQAINNQLDSDSSKEAKPTSTKKALSGLDIAIDMGGTNMSLGQRQLVCLARALLKKSKIVILDEATAAIDVETDRFVQEVIRSVFKDSTVITIAHRLNTIMDSDYILVLEKGQVAEFDNPQVLSNNKDSLFYQLIQQANETE
ncbi:hypothetical protein BB560_004870 [Smittium megazygosporum]|uniref:Uncharacterized protein n=1 Tax=Smittium megazygosporum TaxID=133381 RepID=A0A2T9Z813_9FUNG|nr:hypothetical protein BB560_004870 [Smittium megazygosporum]